MKASLKLSGILCGLLAATPSWAVSAAYGKFKTTCAGPTNAKGALIYLHGLRAIGTAPEGDGNRQILIRFAEKHNLRLAMIASELSCRRYSENAYCWPAKAESEVEQIWNAIAEHSRGCFTSAQQQNYGVIGFSNGGYFAGKMLMNPNLKGPKFVWTFGVGEVTTLLKLSRVAYLEQHPLIMAVGDRDIERKTTEAFTRQMIARYPKTIKFLPFTGGHQIKADVLEEQWPTVAPFLQGVSTRK